MVTYNLISAVICMAIGFAMLRIDAKKNGIIHNGEQYLPTRFRWLVTLGDALGISSILLFLKALNEWLG